MLRTLSKASWVTIANGLILFFALAGLIIATIVIWILWSSPNIPPEALKDAPSWVSQFLVPLLLQRLRPLLVVVAILGLAFSFFLAVLARKFNDANKVSFLGFEFEIPNEITRLQRELDTQTEHVISLQENTRELQDLIEEQSLLILNPDVAKYFDYLDKIVETAAFVIRPGARSVRASVWLYKKASDELQIIAGYRISHATRRSLVLKIQGQGFAPYVLRSQQPQELTNPTTGNNWIHDPNSISSTTSILGEPIRIGLSDDWRALLCFSTDRDLAKFPQYKFSVLSDAPTLHLFAALISFALTLSQSIRDQSTGQFLIERLFQRYR